MATPTSLPASFVTGNVLTAAQMNDLRGAFRILQVVAAEYATLAQNSTNTYVDTGLTATITPSSTSSKILVAVAQSGCMKVGNQSFQLRLMRGVTEIGNSSGGYTNTTTTNGFGSICFLQLDSPNTTSATTYKTQFRADGNISEARVQDNSSRSGIVLLEVSA